MLFVPDDDKQARSKARSRRAPRPRDVRAADLQEELTKTAAPREHRSERSERLDRASPGE
jgi:hypothetical protein